MAKKDHITQIRLDRAEISANDDCLREFIGQFDGPESSTTAEIQHSGGCILFVQWRPVERATGRQLVDVMEHVQTVLFVIVIG